MALLLRPHRLLLLLLSSCCFLFSGFGADSGSVRAEADVTVTVNGNAPIARTDDNYICATLDWWPPEKCDYGECSWNNASLLNVDLMNPVLQNAVEAFSPLRIRLGGSLQDQVVYNIGQPINSCVHFYRNSSALFGFSGGCLPMWRWDALNDFFHKTRSQVAFGLNALYGRSHVNGVFGPWNTNNARDLIQYSLDHGYRILAWELGNELSGNGVGTRIPANQYAADVQELHKIVNEIYVNQPYQPLVVSPDGFFDKHWFWEFLVASGQHIVNIVSIHIYNLGAGVDKNLVQKILSPDFLDRATKTFRDLQNTLRQYCPWGSAWIGEAGGAYNSGRHLVTDAFVSGFWYLDQLGMAAKVGTKCYCRQSLIGGNYGLLNTTTYHPNPDYYGALLWQRLMGSNVLATVSDSQYLRAYAHCSKKAGDLSVLLINMSNSTTYRIHLFIELPLPVSSGVNARPIKWNQAILNIFRGFLAKEGQKLKEKFHVAARNADLYSKTILNGKGFLEKKGIEMSRQEFHLTAKNGEIQGQNILLNGKLLEVTADGEIPALIPNIVSTSQPITLVPLSIAFVSLPAQIPTCLY